MNLPDTKRLDEAYGRVNLRRVYLDLSDSPERFELIKRANLFRGKGMNRHLLLEQLQRHEGLRLRAYLDTVGKLTIGYGRNLDDRGISADEAGFMLDNDIDLVVAELESLPLYLSLNPVRRVVLANMCFNLGMPRLLGFKRMIAALCREDFHAAAFEMLDSKWADQVGERAVELAGLMITGTVPE